MTKTQRLPEFCYRMYTCSAPLCPLDEKWRERKMLPGERVCFFLNEAVKDGAARRFEGGTAQDIYALAAQALPEMLATGGNLRKRLVRAAKTGTRLERKPPRRTQLGGMPRGQQDSGPADASRSPMPTSDTAEESPR